MLYSVTDIISRITTDRSLVDKAEAKDNDHFIPRLYLFASPYLSRANMAKDLVVNSRQIRFVGSSVLTDSLCFSFTGANWRLSGSQLVPPPVCPPIGSANILISNIPGSANC